MISLPSFIIGTSQVLLDLCSLEDVQKSITLYCWLLRICRKLLTPCQSFEEAV